MAAGTDFSNAERCRMFLNDAECSLHDAECSLNDAERSQRASTACVEVVYLLLKFEDYKSEPLTTEGDDLTSAARETFTLSIV